jgi:peroxiredoxin Q/BCP
LSDYRGQTVALYFYFKDFTSGYTTEACTFRDSYAKIKKAGIPLLGCSVDAAEDHRAFIKKYGLPFPLLLDPDKKIATEYGVANGIAKYGLDGRIDSERNRKNIQSNGERHCEDCSESEKIKVNCQ